MEVDQAKKHITRWLKDYPKLSARERDERANTIDAGLATATDGGCVRGQFQFLRENMACGLAPEQVALRGLGAYMLVFPSQH